MRRVMLAAVLLVATVVAPGGAAVAAPRAATGSCVEGRLPHGALSLICVPEVGWNGELLVFAHGYVAPDQPLGFYHLTLPDGASLAAVAGALGFAFATTSYRRNGLAVLEGIEDIAELVQAFRAAHGPPGRTYLTGASEGALVTMLALERSPGLFDGALAACGPIGDFRAQITYIGDHRVLFDHFFPGVLPGSPIEIPHELMAKWESTYAPRVAAALLRDPRRAREFLATSGAPVDLADPWAVVTTTLGILWYNVVATNDARAQLGGNAYGNVGRWYSGSEDDRAVNLGVARIAADAAALRGVESYETSGVLPRPAVVLHTLGDGIVPFAHALVYAATHRAEGGGVLTTLPALRYGHCAFTAEELVGAFALLTVQVNGQWDVRRPR